MEVVLGQGVGFGDDGNQVDASAQTLHNFNVEGLESGMREACQWELKRHMGCHIRVPCRTDEVQTGVDPQISLLAPLRLLLLPHICFMLVIDEFDNRSP